MNAFRCNGDTCFFDRANLDRSWPLSHVNIRVSGVCPVYTTSLVHRVKSLEEKYSIQISVF